MNFLFYESGRRTYYIGRANGKNENIGWHVKGKMGGLWIDNTRLISSITLLKGSEVLVSDKFVNNIYHKSLIFGETQLEFAAHPNEPAFSVQLSNYQPEHVLKICVDPSATWLKHESFNPILKIKRKRTGAVVTISLNAKRKFVLHTNTSLIGIRDREIIITPSSKPLTCVICDHGIDFSFDEIVNAKNSFYSRYLPQYRKDITFWVQLNALDLYFARESGEGYAAGLPEFPWWFGIDSVYTGLGLLHTPQIELVKASIENLAKHGNGVAPHEVTLTGHVYAKARTNEIPAFAYLVTRYVSLTDELYLMELVDRAFEKLFNILNDDGYPVGEGVVEVPGTSNFAMLDTASWFYALMLELNDTGLINHLRYSTQAKVLLEKLQGNFPNIWNNGELFYDAVSGEKRLFEGHFIQIYPLTFGLVPKELGKKVIKRMKKEGFFTEKGMIHSLPLNIFEAGEYGPTDKNSIVWSLPTILALKAAKNYEDVELEIKMLEALNSALKRGMPGSIPEILPEGGCIVQAWNAFLADVLR